MEKVATWVLTESEAARELSISISGLRKWRKNAYGPRFIRIGRLIRYRSADIEQWLAAHSMPVDQQSELHNEEM